MNKSLLLTSLLIGSQALAAGFTTPEPEKTQPKEFAAFLGQFTVSDSHLNYGVLGPDSATYPSGRNLILKPEHEWGGGAFVRLPIPNQPNDGELGFYSLHQGNQTNTQVANGETIFITELPSQFALATNATEANSHLRANLTTIYGDVGHPLLSSDAFLFRLFAGAQYTHLTHEFSVNYSGLNHGDDTASAEQQSSFTGLGPMMGLDTRYAVTPAVGVLGRMTGALNIGRYNTDQLATGITATQHVELNNPHETRVVPSIDVRLGLQYQWKTSQDISIGFEAGYFADQFFDIIGNNAFVQDGTSSSVRESHNLAFHGPYGLIRVVI